MNTIKMDLGDTGCDGMDGSIWLRRDQWRALVNTVMNYRVLTMVYNTQRYWVFGLCPSSGFFLNN
jgi:hypothetical protein